MFHDLATQDVKEPPFDRPANADPTAFCISGGTHVVLGYQGKRLLAQVTAVERLGTAFVGRVLRYQPGDEPAAGLAPGDQARFRPKDVYRTE